MKYFLRLNWLLFFTLLIFSVIPLLLFSEKGVSLDLFMKVLHIGFPVSLGLTLLKGLEPEKLYIQETNIVKNSKIQIVPEGTNGTLDVISFGNNNRVSVYRDYRTYLNNKDRYIRSKVLSKLQPHTFKNIPMGSVVASSKGVYAVCGKGIKSHMSNLLSYEDYLSSINLPPTNSPNLTVNPYGVNPEDIKFAQTYFVLHEGVMFEIYVGEGVDVYDMEVIFDDSRVGDMLSKEPTRVHHSQLLKSIPKEWSGKVIYLDKIKNN